MKRYACHRLYLSNDQYIRQAVVTIDEEGRVSHYTTLEEESHSTEWIGGIIVLNGSLHFPEENIQEWLKLQSYPTSGPVYAWHLSAFDFEKECTTPESILRCLSTL